MRSSRGGGVAAARAPKKSARRADSSRRAGSLREPCALAAVLVDNYGGFATVSKIVREFYRQILQSATLKPYFQGANMERLIDHQTKFIAHVLGGPAEYTGRELGAAHARLKITAEAFGEVAAILQETLEDAGMEEADVATVMGIVVGARGHVVTA